MSSNKVGAIQQDPALEDQINQLNNFRSSGWETAFKAGAVIGALALFASGAMLAAHFCPHLVAYSQITYYSSVVGLPASFVLLSVSIAGAIIAHRRNERKWNQAIDDLRNVGGQPVDENDSSSGSEGNAQADQIQKLERKNTRLKEKAKTADENHEGWLAEKLELNGEKEKNKKTIEDLTEQLRTAQENIQKQKSEHEKRTGKSEKKGDRAERKAQLEAVQKGLEQIKGELVDSERARDVLMKNLVETAQQRDKLHQEVEKLKAESSSKSEKKSKSSADSKKKEIEKLASELATRDASLIIAESDLETAQDKIAELEQKLKTAEQSTKPEGVLGFSDIGLPRSEVEAMQKRVEDRKKEKKVRPAIDKDDISLQVDKLIDSLEESNARFTNQTLATDLKVEDLSSSSLKKEHEKKQGPTYSKEEVLTDDKQPGADDLKQKKADSDKKVDDWNEKYQQSLEASKKSAQELRNKASEDFDKKSQQLDTKTDTIIRPPSQSSNTAERPLPKPPTSSTVSKRKELFEKNNKEPEKKQGPIYSKNEETVIEDKPYNDVGGTPLNIAKIKQTIANSSDDSFESAFKAIAGARQTQDQDLNASLIEDSNPMLDSIGEHILQEKENSQVAMGATQARGSISEDSLKKAIDTVKIPEEKQMPINNALEGSWLDVHPNLEFEKKTLQ